MTKILSALATVFMTVSSLAQQKISFETSEGYHLGTVVGQKEWQVKTDIANSNFKVVSGKASDGNNSVEVTSNGNYTENLSYLFKKIPEYNRLSVSADVKLEKLDNSDYYMLSLYQNTNGNYAWSGGFNFDYEGGMYADSDEAIKYIQDWEAGKWYHLRIEIDHVTEKNVKYYLDDVLVFTSTLSNKIIRTNELNFEFDNYNSGFIVDNIAIKNMDLLTVSDAAQIKTTIFPNPSSDFINIKSNEKIKVVKIYSAAGSLLKTETGDLSKINISSLLKGQYFISIETESGAETRKFIKD